MSRNYIEIGSAPCDEECVCVDRNKDYLHAMREECNRFVRCIRQFCGPEPAGASLRVKSNPHDFGAYLEVVCYYDNIDSEAIDYAFHVEEFAPTKWNGEGAKMWLETKGERQ